MSEADDILFAPLIEPEPAWRIRYKDVMFKLTGGAYSFVSRIYPPGALRLEDMLEWHFIGKIAKFYEVGDQIGVSEIEFTGEFGTETMDSWLYGYWCTRNSPRQRSLRDSNLLPNGYNNHFVFADENLARQYAATCSP